MEHYLTLDWLVKVWRRSLRNRSWARLSPTSKALIQCALWVAKTRGRIANTRLIAQVLAITHRLSESVQDRIAAAGKKVAIMKIRAYSGPGGVFSWAPQVREWLNSDSYISYLGLEVQL